jgi:DNA mismatch repair protein MutL
LSIRQLEPRLVAKIAAGEVIERPASVVKELIENALDAGATQVAVEIGQGGLELIRVSDNGCGIAADELRLAFERYATSKLPSESSLEQIATLGFRGEALPSIAAVADVDLVSRPPDALGGAGIRLEAGDVREDSARAAATGTVVTVRRLFRRQPARLKFLRSPHAEAGQIGTVITQYALVYPEVRFSLTVDGRPSLRTPGSGDLRDAVAGAYGPDLAGRMLAVAERPPAAPATEISVSGLASPPDLSRANRTYISIFINRRWVRSRPLTYAVQEAYRGLLPTARFPIAVVDIRLPPGDVDVNVHPTKAEVRLRREREVFAVVQRTLRRTLADQAPVPAFRPATPAWGAAPTTPARPVSAAPTPASPPSTLPTSPVAAQPLPPETEPALLPKLPLLRPVGQVGNTYIVAEGPDGMYMIDQHAAHERVLFERILSAQRQRAVEVQGLLEPATVELSPQQEQVWRESAQELSELGFTLEPFGGRAYLVRSVPGILAGRETTQSLLELLDLLGRDEGPADRTERAASSLACHSAIRAGDSLSPEEMRELIQSLERCDTPHTCPHGRPTMIHLSADALAKQFRRK